MMPIKKQNIGLCLIFSFITLGIYYVYWYYLLIRNTHAINNDESSCLGEFLCILFVPFYIPYWWFTRGKAISNRFSKLGYSVNCNANVFLILSLFDLSIISMAIMQNDFNSLPPESIILEQLNDEQSEASPNDKIYFTAKAMMYENKIASYEKAIEKFQIISDYKDSTEQICICQRKIEEIKIKQKLNKKRKKLAIVIVSGVCIGTIFIIILIKVIIPNIEYNSAIAKYGEETWNKIQNIKIGDTYTFGHYEQDNNIYNGKEQIEWQVLAKKDNNILLISKYVLDCKSYGINEVSWETSSIRKWLNDTFFNVAFDVEEQSQILTTYVSADKNPDYTTDPGNSSNDRIFLLSINEAMQYHVSKCIPTTYSIIQGVRTNGTYNYNGKATCWWWLRSPGESTQHAAVIYYDGQIDSAGINIESEFIGVRPAMWISFEY